MAEPIGALRAELSATAAQFEKDMARAARALGMSRDAFKALEKTAMITSAAVAGIVTAATAAAVGVFALTKQVATQGDELVKLSQKVGVSVEDLSSLKLAAGLADVSMEQLGTSLGRLAKSMADAQAGTGDSADAFRRLGVSVENVGTKDLRSIASVLADLADKFARMPDGATKTALAMDLMGRSGAGMIPLLNAGTESLKEMQAASEKLGVAWSTRDAQAAEAFNDSLTTIGYALGGLQKRVMGDLIPALTDFAKEITSFVASDEMRQWAKDVGESLLGAAKGLKELLQFLHVLPTTGADRIRALREEIASLQALAAKAPAASAWEKQIMGGVSIFEARIKTLQERLAALQAVQPPDVTPSLGPKALSFLPGPPTPGKDKTTDGIYESLKAQAAVLDEANEYGRKFLVDEAKRAEDMVKIVEQRDADTIASWVAKIETQKALDFKAAEDEVKRLEDVVKVREGLNAQEVENLKWSLGVEQEAWGYYFKYLADESAKSAAKIQAGVEAIFEPFSRALQGTIQGILQGTQTAEEAFKRMGQNIAASLFESVVEHGLKEVQKALVQFFQSVSSSSGSWGNALSSVVQALGSVSARASGGPVSAGGAYLVGEQGPELFVPHTGGAIVPHGAMGAPTIFIDARKAERGVSVEILQAIRTGMGQAVNVSVARVQDLSRRGGMRGLSH